VLQQRRHRDKSVEIEYLVLPFDGFQEGPDIGGRAG
jgi:hypothetical protein